MTINRQNFPPAAGRRGAFIFLRFSDSENSGGRLLISENLPKSAGGRLLRGGGYLHMLGRVFPTQSVLRATLALRV